MPAPIAFLSDFGLTDNYVGVVKGVILATNPAAQVIDLSHAVPPQDVRAGAFLLMTAVGYFPVGTVFLGVVDPGVGTQRVPVAIEAAGYRFVGPDNGLLSWALRRLARDRRLDVEEDDQVLYLGGHPRIRRPTVPPGAASVSAVALTATQYWQPSVSATFHGRDIFGPVAAHLSLGVPLHQLGQPVTSLRALPFPTPARTHEGRHGEVIYVDRFGNLVTSLAETDVPAGAWLRIGERLIGGLSPHYQQAEELIALVGSSGLVEISVPNGSAAEVLAVEVGTRVTVTRSRPPGA